LLAVSRNAEADMTTKKTRKGTNATSKTKVKQVEARVLTEQELEMVTGGSGAYDIPISEFSCDLTGCGSSPPWHAMER
jgi:hypothetical protein